MKHAVVQEVLATSKTYLLVAAPYGAFHRLLKVSCVVATKGSEKSALGRGRRDFGRDQGDQGD